MWYLSLSHTHTHTNTHTQTARCSSANEKEAVWSPQVNPHVSQTHTHIHTLIPKAKCDPSSSLSLIFLAAFIMSAFAKIQYFINETFKVHSSALLRNLKEAESTGAR